MKRLTAAFLCTAAVLGAAPPALSPSKAGMDEARLAQIPARMKAYVDKGTVAGTVTLIQRHGSPATLEAVGYQDLATKKPMRTDTIFQIMSMSKPFTATALMILMEEGKLTISDPVEKYLPEFQGMWMLESHEGNQERVLRRPPRKITIRDLLTHTSGMYGTPPPALATVKDFTGRPLAEVVAIGSQQPLDFAPGTKWQYSNIGIETAGRIIEVVADQPFEKFISARIFEPLGMKDSYYFPPPEKFDRIASCYVLKDGKLEPMGPDTLGGGDWKYRKGARNPLPDGGIYSTASDLALFYQMLLNGGTLGGKRLLSKGAVELMTRVHTGDLTSSPGMGYGLAWAVVKDPMGSLALPLSSVGSYGHGGAFGTYGWVDPKNDMLGVFLVQRPSATEERNTFMSLAGSAIVN